MLSYQHMYHAGGPADVHKHAALARMLEQIAQSDASCTYVETHAGRGLYDLRSAEAAKTKEAERGILALDDGQSPILPAAYRRAIASARAVHGPNIYPGSPVIAQILLRSSDPMHLAELHPREVAALRQEVYGHGIQIRQMDGFEVAAEVLAQTKDQGFLLIDPSYEIKSDYEQAARFVVRMHTQHAGLRVLLWYPILEAGLHHIISDILEKHIGQSYERDHVMFPATMSPRLLGSGLIGINLPDRLAPTDKSPPRLAN